MSPQDHDHPPEPDPVGEATPPGQDNHPEVERSSRAPRLGIILAAALGVVALVLLLEVIGISIAG